MITPATSPRTSTGAPAVPSSLPPPATAAPPTPPATTTAPATTAATTTVPVPTVPTSAGPVVTEPADGDAGAQPTRCLSLDDVLAVRHDARTGVVRVEGSVGNCGSLDATFVVRVSDVTDHADPACGAGTRSTPVLVLGPASGDVWSVLTYPAPCPEPYTFRVTAVDADGGQLAMRSLSFEG